MSNCDYDNNKANDIKRITFTGSSARISIFMETNLLLVNFTSFRFDQINYMYVYLVITVNM